MLNHEPDRAKIDHAMHAYHVFNLTVKIVGAGLKHEFSNDEYNRIWQVVKDVAAGEITLNISPTEHAMIAPPLTQGMRDSYETNFQRNKQREQATAVELLKACEGFCS